jgi:ABC-type nitrate/sulfonate/bicarbonate transport system substrate-binding protein
VSSAAVDIALKEFGLDRRRDGIIFLPAGSSNERLTAVTTGGIHATVLSVGQYPRIASLESQGKLRILADLSKLRIDWDHCYLLTTGRFRDANRDTVERLVKSIVQAHAFILDPRNKEAVKASIARNLGYGAEQELTADQIYDHIPSTVVAKPYPSEKAVLTLVNLLKDEFPNLSKVDVKRLLDPSFLQKLDRDGFIDSLAPKPATGS